jgi:hypothetical protein
VRQLRRRKISVLIITDIAADQDAAMIRQAAKHCRIIIIDHHKVYPAIKHRNVLVIKPQLIQKKAKPSRYCASKLAYDLASRLVDVKDLDWVAATGTIADIATQPWKRWLAGVFRKHHVRSKKDLFKTTLGQVAIVINSAMVYNSRNTPAAFKITYDARKPADVLRSRLKRYHAAIEHEIRKWIRLLDVKAEKHPEHELVLYYLEPKFHTARSR